MSRLVNRKSSVSESLQKFLERSGMRQSGGETDTERASNDVVKECARLRIDLLFDLVRPEDIKIPPFL